jgi:hypothetical protein
VGGQYLVSIARVSWSYARVNMAGVSWSHVRVNVVVILWSFKYSSVGTFYVCVMLLGMTPEKTTEFCNSENVSTCCMFLLHLGSCNLCN